MSSIVDALDAAKERLRRAVRGDGPVPPEPGAPRRGRRAVIGALVAVVVLAVAVVGFQLGTANRDGTGPAASAVAEPPVAAPPVLPSVPSSAAAAQPEQPEQPGPAGSAGPSGTAEPAPPDDEPFAGAPEDPHDAFTDPELLAMAEPYLTDPEAICVADAEPGVNLRERVSCYLGGGWVGNFQTMLTPELARVTRDGHVLGDGVAEPGSVRSLRWKDAPGRPGVKTGIRAGSPDRGAGVRVRFVSLAGTPWLYFDREGTAVLAYLSSVYPDRDLDDLRAYWADPGR